MVKWLKLWYPVVYNAILLFILYNIYIISILSCLYYYRNFVYSPQSTQFHLLVTVCTINSITFSNSVASEWIAGHIRRVYYHKTYYTYLHLKPLTEAAIQLYRYSVGIVYIKKMTGLIPAILLLLICIFPMITPVALSFAL